DNGAHTPAIGGSQHAVADSTRVPYSSGMSRLKKFLIGLVVVLVILAVAGWWILRGDPAEYSLEQVSGTDPLLAEPDPQMIPTVGVAKPIGWPDGAAPEAAAG